MTKQNRQGQKKKPREEWIYARTVGEVTEISIVEDRRTGRVCFGDDFTDVVLERSYQRSKGAKVISRVPQSSPFASFDVHDALDASFQYVIAVDTNTRVIRGRRVSVVGVVSLWPHTFAERQATGWEWGCDVPFCIQYVGVRAENPEMLGWLAAIEELYRRELIGRDSRIGLIVDSELGNLRAYNERSKPLFGSVSLSSNCELIYASADVDRECVPNGAIALADRASSHCLSLIEGGDVPLECAFGACDLYDGRRVIKIENAQAR